MEAQGPSTVIERMEREKEGGGSQFYRFELFGSRQQIGREERRERMRQRVESSSSNGEAGAWQGKRTFSVEIVQNWRVALSSRRRSEMGKRLCFMLEINLILE